MVLHHILIHFDMIVDALVRVVLSAFFAELLNNLVTWQLFRIMRAVGYLHISKISGFELLSVFFIVDEAVDS